MERVFVLLKRKPGMSFEAFREHYENSHAKLGEKYFGHLFASYRRNYIPEGMRFADGSLGENAYDCVIELVFREVGGYAVARRWTTRSGIWNTLPRTSSARWIERELASLADPLDEQLVVTPFDRKFG
jgi:hypothetical protein